VNLQIVRVFIALRQFALDYFELNQKLENFMRETNMQFHDVYQAFAELSGQKKLENNSRNPIGYQHY
jgi:hypothetical protein